MADFKVAFAKTIRFEGGYVNHKADKGGETYKGIARNFWPKWKGWGIIDGSVKNDKVLGSIPALQKLVEDFYKVNFWDAINGDLIADQRAADNIFDFAVNSGVKRAITYAQLVVGATRDGVLGPITAKKINGKHSFTTEYKKLRLDFVNKIVKNNPSQKVFLNGWTRRIKDA